MADGGSVPDEIKTLQKWNKKTQVLVVTDLGPEGDGLEAYETVIKACK